MDEKMNVWMDEWIYGWIDGWIIHEVLRIIEDQANEHIEWADGHKSHRLILTVVCAVFYIHNRRPRNDEHLTNGKQYAILRQEAKSRPFNGRFFLLYCQYVIVKGLLGELMSAYH